MRQIGLARYDLKCVLYTRTKVGNKDFDMRLVVGV